MDPQIRPQQQYSQPEKLQLERLFKQGLFSAICQLPSPGRFINDPPLSAVLAMLRSDFSKFDQMVKTFPLLDTLCQELLASLNRSPFHQALPSRLPPPPPPPAQSRYNTMPQYSVLPATPAMLHNAARDGNLYKMQDLANKDNTLLYEGDDVGYNVLHISAQHGRVDVVKYLVDTMHMDVNCISLPGYTPLILAAMEGHAKIVSFLLKSGANVYQTDGENKTAIDYALIFNHEEVIKALFPDERERLKLSCSGEIPFFAPPEEVKQPEPVKSVQSPPQVKKDPWWDEPENNTNKKDSAPLTENWEDLANKTETKSNVNNNAPNTTTTPSSDTGISFSAEEQTRLDQLVDSIFGTNTPIGPLETNESDVMLLIRRIVQLERDLKGRHEKINKLEEQSLCCICMDNTANVVLLECNHLIVCHECTTTKQLKQCPVCNNQITRVLKIYHAS